MKILITVLFLFPFITFAGGWHHHKPKHHPKPPPAPPAVSPSSTSSPDVPTHNGSLLGPGYPEGSDTYFIVENGIIVPYSKDEYYKLINQHVPEANDNGDIPIDHGNLRDSDSGSGEEVDLQHIQDLLNDLMKMIRSLYIPMYNKTPSVIHPSDYGKG